MTPDLENPDMAKWLQEVADAIKEGREPPGPPKGGDDGDSD
jgi:hypothetical protein